MKLKRCPFCNSHALSLEATHCAYQISCVQCGATGPLTFETKEHAAQLWNQGEPDSTSMVNMQRKYTNRDDLMEIDL